MDDKRKLELISELVKIGLTYSVKDYVYILQDIEKILNNVEVNIRLNNYLD